MLMAHACNDPAQFVLSVRLLWARQYSPTGATGLHRQWLHVVSEAGGVCMPMPKGAHSDRQYLGNERVARTLEKGLQHGLHRGGIRNIHTSPRLLAWEGLSAATN